MKVGELKEALSSVDDDLEVMTSKGEYSAEVLRAEVQKMCRYDHGNHKGYWRKCNLELCDNETADAFWIT